MNLHVSCLLPTHRAACSSSLFNVCSRRPDRKPSLFQLHLSKLRSLKTPDEPPSSFEPQAGPSTEALPSVEVLKAQLEQLNSRVRCQLILRILDGRLAIPTYTEPFPLDHRHSARGRQA